MPMQQRDREADHQCDQIAEIKLLPKLCEEILHAFSPSPVPVM